MGLEVATTIAGLVATNPVSGDTAGQGDDHIRLIKTVLQATPFVVDRAYAEYTTNADISAVIPFDDTIPQNTEGTQILTDSITPKTTTARIRIRFQCTFICGTTGVNVTAALFNNSGLDAIRSNFSTNSAAGFAQILTLEHEYCPGSTSEQTYNIRIGPNASTIRLNGSASGRLFGGTMAATLTLEEIAV